MAKAERQRIFISYARRDGSELARRLEKDLTAAGFDVWLDTQRIRGGATWTVAIEKAIDRAQAVLAILTPGSYASEICRAEQLRSLRNGKCVIPLRGAAKTDIPLHLEAKNYSDFSDERVYKPSLKLLLGDIGTGKGVVLQDRYRSTPDAYITAPPQVPNYVDRSEAVQALRNTLFNADEHCSIAVTAVDGMGGIGKTVLAQAVFKDEVVRQAFPDGLVWITVGREPTHDVTSRLREITSVLGGPSSDTISPETLYRTTVAEKAALIVIDDIWNKADLDPFLAESPRSRFLFTTRDASIVRFSQAREHCVGLLDPPQARELLALWTGRTVSALPPAAGEILRECAGLPLALSTIGGLLNGAEPSEWTDTVSRLRNADLAAIEDLLPPGQTSFFRAIDVSVKALTPKLQRHYQQLAVLLEDSRAPLPVLRTLWNVDEAGARLIAHQLTNRSLAQPDGESAIRLHDLQSDYVRATYPERDTLDLIRGAVRLSAHVIENDPRQFASQVSGRLLVYRATPAVQVFLDDIARGAPLPWLRLRRPALHPPGTPLLSTLEGHSDSVWGVAVTPDGQRAVSASADKTLKVWDLQSGRALRTLEGHTDSVSGVAVTPDGQRAVSASWDKTLKVWDLQSGRALHTLEGHSAPVRGVAVTPDGQRAVSASSDKTLKVWDLQSGRALHTLEGHSGYVSGVAVTPDGQRAVSASSDKTLKVWDLQSGRALHTLEGHSGYVRGVAVTPDGQRAVSASWDKTLKVWDLQSGRALHTLEGHSGYVSGVAVTPDGQRAVSASWDNTLKVWDLQSGRALHTLEGHSAPVRGVAVTPDGQRAVSASSDDTLKVWDLQSGHALHTLEGHSAPVRGVAVTPDGRRAVSASWDKTLKVWDLQSGRVLHTLEGHSAPVSGVAVTPDGQRAVSASDDDTLKVWDLQSGRALHTLEGHSAPVRGVAVTPDGQRAVSASSDKTLKVWDLQSGRPLHTLEGHSALVRGVAVTPDGQRAVSASSDKTLKVWDLQSGHALHTLGGHSAPVRGVAVTPDGQRAVSASWDKTLKVWDLQSGRALHTLEGHSALVSGVAVTPDGQRAVSASSDKTLKVWDLQSGQLIVTFHCDGDAQCAAFMDERRIMAGDAGGRVYFLSLEDGSIPKMVDSEQY